MSDDTTTDGLPITGELFISYTEVMEFLSGRGVNRPCPACGSDSGSLVLDDRDGIAPIGLDAVKSHRDRSLEKMNSGIGAFVLECTNCGHLRLFALKKLIDWHLSQGKK